MIIQWFPGHMNKALKMMQEEVKKVDAIIYVLDSRAPFSCVNPKFTSIIGDKPIIYVFNKCDIADMEKVKDWVTYFSKENTRCIILNSTASGSSAKIVTALRDLLKDRIEKYAKKDVTMILRAMIVGVPNSGKSTLANNLCGKTKAKAENRAGVTKSKQWVRIGTDVEVLDTPGTLWPAFNNNQVAHHLAYIGSIKDDVLDIPELSLDFIADIVRIDKKILEDRYSITISDEDASLEILDKICIARKYVMRGGDIDYDRGSMALISEFKQGRLGNITLETVKDIRRLSKRDRKEEKDA